MPNKLEKLKTFKANENLAIFDSIEELNETLSDRSNDLAHKIRKI